MCPRSTVRLDICTCGPRREKTCLRRFANNKGADQPAQPRSLISPFVIRCLESTISKLTIYERNFDFLARLCSCGDWFESHFVGSDPEDRFSQSP